MGRQHVDFLRAASGAELSAVADPVARDEIFACPTYQETGVMLDAEDMTGTALTKALVFGVEAADLIARE